MKGAHLEAAERAVARGRAQREQLMVFECTLAEPGNGDPVYDGAAGTSHTPPNDPYYTGPCLVTTDQVVSTTEAGGEQILSDRWPAELPTSVTSVRRGHILTVTSSPDPLLVGRSLRVADVDSTQLAVSRRLVLERNG